MGYNIFFIPRNKEGIQSFPIVYLVGDSVSSLVAILYNLPITKTLVPEEGVRKMKIQTCVEKQNVRSNSSPILSINIANVVLEFLNILT